MSRIDELIAQYCPDGVQFLRIGDVAEVGTGSSDRKDASEDGRYPFYVRSKSVFKIDSYEFDEDAIVIPGEGGIGEIFHFVSGKYALHQRAYRICFRTSAVDTKYTYYYFQVNFKKFILQKAVSATVISIRKPMILDFRIPVPPLEVQREIVRMLDQFTQLEAELEAELGAELEARRRQYAHYRDSLLSFGEGCVRWVPIAELLREPLANGRSVPDGSGYPVLRLTALHGSVVDVSQQKLGAWDKEIGRRFRIEAGDLLVVRGNGSKDLIARACMVTETAEVAFPDTMIRLRPDLEQVSQRYLFYVWGTPATRHKIARLAKLTSGVYKISQSDLSRLDIPVPPLEEQRRIVSILDKFDALVNDLSVGLPAELAARRKQYEHYRDRLLTFKEAS